ncbi:hypothetical protein [Desulfuromonas acetoxidans]|uniref:hypothetical protein n=1 Tax=Desulfuromonas acetoxidans TaxID=891 RepID=UPI00292E18CF|nr:hypothetical protein [Desulfuromonas acetoxidans]
MHQLHALNPDQIDDLHSILEDWNVEAAKTVLDELQWRIKLIDELQEKTASSATLEVQELQPLFERGLWIFGPEFETIEFSSNRGMTTVIQKLCNKQMKGSLNRPDFAILPDGTAGLYSYPDYGEDHSEIGVARLVILELKKPTVKIGDDEKSQSWKYVKELYAKGCIGNETKVSCYVLGSLIEQNENDETTHKDGKVTIRPLLFNTVLTRAKSRVLKLYDKVKTAPFLQKEEIDSFLKYEEVTNVNAELFKQIEDAS